ncbi:Inositolphosphorylceramide Synthase [Klebsormidium nitens]|uniref:Inositolphosphorylceramide Synthase n=1 Tax=Klebsormidium nitens TaxID=105231 RepID=A0A1Y1IB15_KLENI|nr:Inositolphosphorylceramide Synthase [Klebsormidium nitens]|eukprot:GAQ85288.1 Inositolphosphorylceramide Synthase [Klebsormidium nitens]
MPPFDLLSPGGPRELWRRICMEWVVEWPLLVDRWKIILAGVVFQYMHGIGARFAHYLHRPGPLLHDVGFELIPELGKKNIYVSETVFSGWFVFFVLWTFHPFFLPNKRFYTVFIWQRVLTVLVICQCLRIASFTATQLPGPNYHCHEGSPWATLPVPHSFKDLFFLNIARAGMFGCGDLIFSSHMSFALVFMLTYNKYGTTRLMKMIGWTLVTCLGLLIIASRKHYSVDVVVAAYVVPLVFIAVDKYISEAEIDRSALPSPAQAGSFRLDSDDKQFRQDWDLEKNVVEGDSYKVESRQRMPNGKTLPDIKVGNPADSSKVTRATVKGPRRDSDGSQGFAAPSHLGRTSSTHDLDSGRIASDRP